MCKPECTQLENQTRFLEPELQPQTAASPHTRQDHLLWSTQTGPGWNLILPTLLMVMIQMMQGIMPGPPREASWARLCHFCSRTWSKANRYL